MDTTLQILKAKIQSYIRSKAVATPEPGRVKAVDTAEILEDLTDYCDYLAQEVTGPPAPDGVSWYNAPGKPTLTATTVAETQSEVNNAGTIVVIPAKIITFPLAASGKKRKDAIVASYTADPPFYARIAGEEVDANAAILPTPNLNQNDLFVRWVDVTDSAIIQAPANAVKSISVNGTTEFPDANGDVNLVIETGGGTSLLDNNDAEMLTTANSIIEAKTVAASRAIFASPATNYTIPAATANDFYITPLANISITASGVVANADYNIFITQPAGGNKILSFDPAKIKFNDGTPGIFLAEGRTTVIAGKGQADGSILCVSPDRRQIQKISINQNYTAAEIPRIIFNDATATNPITVTIPAVPGANQERYEIINKNTNAAATITLAGAVSGTVPARTIYTLYFDGSDYQLTSAALL